MVALVGLWGLALPVPCLGSMLDSVAAAAVCRTAAADGETTLAHSRRPERPVAMSVAVVRHCLHSAALLDCPAQHGPHRSFA